MEISGTSIEKRKHLDVWMLGCLDTGRDALALLAQQQIMRF